jgi:hypothetical protein
MELLKVFVGDGGTTGTTVNNMIEGDLLLVTANDHVKLTASIAAGLADNVLVQIVAKNSKGLKFSTPMKRSEVSYVNYKAKQSVAQKVMNVGFGFSTTTLSDFNSKTFTLGVQIKEDLRMGTYNKNTEILASHVCPSTAYASVTKLLEDMSGNLAKGFAANPLTSAGSPYQLVKIERVSTATKTSLAIATETFTFTKGSRMVTIGTDVASTFTAGKILSVGQGSSTYDAIYVVEKKGVYDSGTTTTTFYLDTAYQGESSTNLVATGTTSGTTVGSLSALTVADLDFKVTGIAQTRTNRYDQSRVIDFVIVSPKGFDGPDDIAVTTESGFQYPIGSWAQVRDLEEKAFTNVNPLINYREFPFEDFALNVNAIATSAEFNQFVLVHSAGNGYNYMQSSSKDFPQTTIAAVVSGTNDGTVGSDNYFGSVLTAWWSKDSTPTSAQFA